MAIGRSAFVRLGLLYAGAASASVSVEGVEVLWRSPDPWLVGAGAVLAVVAGSVSRVAVGPVAVSWRPVAAVAWTLPGVSLAAGGLRPLLAAGPGGVGGDALLRSGLVVLAAAGYVVLGTVAVARAGGEGSLIVEDVDRAVEF